MSVGSQESRPPGEGGDEAGKEPLRAGRVDYVSPSPTGKPQRGAWTTWWAEAHRPRYLLSQPGIGATERGTRPQRGDTASERGHGHREGTRPQRGSWPQRGTRPQQGDMASERGHSLGEGHCHRERTWPRRGDTASERGHSLGDGHCHRQRTWPRRGTWSQRGDTASEREHGLGEGHGQ